MGLELEEPGLDMKNDECPGLNVLRAKARCAKIKAPIRVLVLVLTVSIIIVLKYKVITELHAPIDSQKYNLLVLSIHNV